MSTDERILAVDVGAGTQDILIYEPGVSVENSVQMVLPSQTVVTSRRIQRATVEGQDIFMTGNLMGGGASVRAIQAHLAASYRVYATPLAAKTIRDDLEQVQAMGVLLADEPPESAVVVETRDVDLQAIGGALAAFQVRLPTRFAVAVQDHGECFGCSQRKFRFQLWEQFLQQGGQLVDLAYINPPAHLTRMRAVQADLPGAVVMDTAGAAIWGALQDEAVAAHQAEGLIVVNIGNGHTVGALVQGERVWGLFEHHTGRMTTAKLGDYVERLRLGTLTNAEVFDDGGHGCQVQEGFRQEGDFAFVAVTGPNWRLANGLGYYRATPHGDMMIAGCFGLVAAAQAIR